MKTDADEFSWGTVLTEVRESALFKSFVILLLLVGIQHAFNFLTPRSAALSRGGDGYDVGVHGQCEPSMPVADNRNTYTKRRNQQGQFVAKVCSAGTMQDVVITTSWPSSVLSFEQAVAFGLNPKDLVYDDKVFVGSRKLQVARAYLPAIQIGDISLKGFDLFVARENDINAGFLGYDFLRSLKSYDMVPREKLAMLPN